MNKSTPFVLLATALVAFVLEVRAELFRKPVMDQFAWVVDPHAADPCTSEPGCFNHVKYGYDVVPRNVSKTKDECIVFQEAARPTNLAATFFLDVYTQPGCEIWGCTTEKFLGIFPRERCYNQFVEFKPNQPDNKTALVHFGGIYYEHLPEGELYAKFVAKNFFTDKPTCTFEVRKGFKRWF